VKSDNRITAAVVAAFVVGVIALPVVLHYIERWYSYWLP
jgi:hypothetical protein